MFKYVPLISGGKEPILTEHDEFRVTIPYIDEEHKEVSNDTPDVASDGVNDGVKQTYEIIKATEGIKAPQIAKKIGKSLPTVERYLRSLRKKGLIEYRGSDKTGGYLSFASRNPYASAF